LSLIAMESGMFIVHFQVGNCSITSMAS